MDLIPGGPDGAAGGSRAAEGAAGGSKAPEGAAGGSRAADGCRSVGVTGGPDEGSSIPDTPIGVQPQRKKYLINKSVQILPGFASKLPSGKGYQDSTAVQLGSHLVCLLRVTHTRCLLQLV